MSFGTNGSEGGLAVELLRRLWSRQQVRALILGLASGALCVTPLAAYLNPLFYLGIPIGHVSESVAGQLLFSGPGVIFGAAFWILLRMRNPVEIKLGMVLVGISVTVWLLMLNLGISMMDKGHGPTWIGPLCAGMGGFLFSLLVLSVFLVFRDLRFVLSSTVLTTLAGLVPVTWQNFPFQFDVGWLALFVTWQCSVLICASFWPNPS
ncbi:hypothetical protein NKI12_28500 [Mesorhizobium australicum]|uniref:Uncharacterized protein n=1 Tax=Mesorhizobium australicum TaxID=536018 RepID=A0ACC6T7S1_9HYPH